MSECCMSVKMFLAVVLVSGAVCDARAQRNTDVPNGPAVWPLLKPTPQGKSELPAKPSPGAKDKKDNEGGNPAGDTTGATGKGNSAGRGK
jgi:hypothetical protein